METLGQCIHAWMQAEDVSVSQLTVRLGYKSRTSLFRLLHGKSNYRSCVQFCKLMTPDLNEYWKTRFHQALLTEKVGLKRYELLDALHRSLFEENTNRTSFRKSDPFPFSQGTVTVLGCTWPGSYSLIDELLAASDHLQIIHFFTSRDIFDAPGLLPSLVTHMTNCNYSAMLLKEEVLYGTALPWNIALWTDHDSDRTCIMLMHDGKYSWHPLSGGAAEAQSILSVLEELPQTILYRNDQLQTNKDYIEFTEQSYHMEYNRKTLIFKPTPGIQMLPPDIVEQTFIDYLAENLEPVSAAQDMLIYIFEKRAKNFYAHTKPVSLLFSLEAMLRFAQSGLIDDHFFACRPFTKGERATIFQSLQSFSKEENVYISFLDHKSWPVSVEAYDGKGVLFYPSSSSYQTSKDLYRELFLPGKEYSDLLFQFAREYGYINNCGLKNQDGIYRKLLNSVGM